MTFSHDQGGLDQLPLKIFNKFFFNCFNKDDKFSSSVFSEYFILHYVK